MVGGALLWCNQIPYLLSGRSTKWKRIILQSFSHRSESSEPHVRLPSWGPDIGRRSPQSIWFWRPAGLECRSSTGLGETKTPYLEGAHKVSCALGPTAKQWLHRSLGQTYLWVLESLLGRWGSALTHCWGKDTGGGVPWEYSSSWALLEVAILPLRPGPTQLPAGSSAGTSQAKQPIGWEHSPTHQQTGCLMCPEPTAASKHTPWHSPAHQKDKTQLHPPVGRHRSLPPGSLHKPLDQPHPPEGRQQKQSYSLWNRDHKDRKLDKMRWHRNMFQM